MSVLWQAVKFAVLCVEIIHIRRNTHRRVRCLRDEFARRKLAPMLVDVVAQPGTQRAELSLCNLAGNVGISFNCGRIELGAEKIADGVALKPATDGAGAVPMHILKTPVAIVDRSDTEIGLHARAPSFGEIFYAETPFKQIELEVEAHHNMQIIGDFIGVRANQRAFHLIDRAIESVEPYLSELIRKPILQNRVKVLPKRAAAADDIFPKPRLALMDSQRAPSPQGGAVKFGR